MGNMRKSTIYMQDEDPFRRPTPTPPPTPGPSPPTPGPSPPTPTPEPDTREVPEYLPPDKPWERK